MNAILEDLEHAEFRARWLRRLVSSARRRGKQFALSDHIAEQLYQQQRGRCAVTGIQFSMERKDDALVKHPFAPSLDRRSSKGGYTDDNVRLVCVATNFGMGQWGEEVFLRLAEAAVALRTEKEATGQAPEYDPATADWYRIQHERIDAAENVLLLLPKHQQAKLAKQIAGLKSALKKGPQRLKEIAEVAARIKRARIRAKEALGDPVKAERWLRERLGVLGGESPLEAARTEDGAKLVDEILAKIEWGAPA